MPRSNILKSCAFIARGKSMIFLSHACFEVSMISKHRTAVQHSFVFRNFTIIATLSFVCSVFSWMEFQVKTHITVALQMLPKGNVIPWVLNSNLLDIWVSLKVQTIRWTINSENRERKWEQATKLNHKFTRKLPRFRYDIQLKFCRRIGPFGNHVLGS